MFESPGHRLVLIPLILASTGLVACGSFNSASNRIAGMVTPYKMDVVQGNFVSKEQAQAVKPGMSRIQVRDILGTPLVASIFHADRWDYVFTFKRQGLEPQARKVSVFFKADVLERIEADELPTEAQFVASLDSGRKAVNVPVLELSPESLKAMPQPEKSEAAKPATGTTGPVTYPPLEPAQR
jgi:outer membrane protein assembly factor BamE